MKKFCSIVIILYVVISLGSCVRHRQNNSPKRIVNTYARSLCNMDIKGVASCFEYGKEAMSLFEGYIDEEVSGYESGDLQRFISAARESQLLPEISYEIVEEDIKGDKGTYRIRFDMEFDDGEEIHKDTRYETIYVYCHKGKWWIGEGLSKKEREMARRVMNFFNKLR